MFETSVQFGRAIDDDNSINNHNPAYNNVPSHNNVASDNNVPSHNNHTIKSHTGGSATKPCSDRRSGCNSRDERP